jgi:aspartate-semialdehyde dehydrogenase
MKKKLFPQNGISVAIVGATGITGNLLTELLAARHFPVNELFLLSSQKSAGKLLISHGKQYALQATDSFDFTKTQLTFFCAGNAVSEKYALVAAAAGNKVIDKSSFFRNAADVPLVIPEVNAHALLQVPRNIIASPNCSTIPIAMVLKPLHERFTIRRVNLVTFQSVSGSGKEGIQELSVQSKNFLAGKSLDVSFYPQQIAFNVVPMIDAIQENGYTGEEMKVVHELRKLLEDAAIAINVTAVRVPVFYGHSAAMHFETEKKISVADFFQVLHGLPGLKVFENPHEFPTPVCDAAGRDEVFVGRLREDISHPNGFNCWIVSDNIRKGAALNAIQIAECLLGQGK